MTHVPRADKATSIPTWQERYLRNGNMGNERHFMEAEIAELRDEVGCLRAALVACEVIARLDLSKLEQLGPDHTGGKYYRVADVEALFATATAPDSSAPSIEELPFSSNPLEDLPGLGLRLAYYVRHPDGSHSYAVPQPTLLKPEYRRLTQPVEAKGATLFGKLDVMEAWACVRKNNSSIPDDALDGMRDVLLAAATGAAPEAKVVPDGWKLVPIEPTQEMLAVDFQIYTVPSGMAYSANKRSCYRAMLAAAPKFKEGE